MGKIICDICGTSYPDIADSCPICGCSRDAASDFLKDDFMHDEFSDMASVNIGVQTAKKKKEIFDFDEVNSYEEEETVETEEYTYEEQEEEQEEERGHNVFVVILLTVLIVALLLAAGFIFFRYFLPNMNEDQQIAAPEATVAVEEMDITETTEVTIPCQMLILSSGTAELTKEGQHFLLHVKASPENTTDVILYASEDESIATVTEDGRITAVSEGETIVNIICGKIVTPCSVVVRYEEETVPTTEAIVAETEAVQQEVTISGDENTTVQESVAETTAGVKDGITLKLKQTDFRLTVYYEHQLMLDCGLEQNEVEWRSEHPHIASVDQNGVVKAIKDGTTSIIAKYGNQEVSCIVRCVY